jgi:hypothetical protein
MPNSFLNKVSAERRVLTVINAHFRGNKQLAGLSKSAIDLWQRKVGAQATDEIIEILVVLAGLCQSLSDRSHESFKPLNQELEEQLEAALITLNTVVLQLKQAG